MSLCSDAGLVGDVWCTTLPMRAYSGSRLHTIFCANARAVHHEDCGFCKFVILTLIAERINPRKLRRSVFNLVL